MFNPAYLQLSRNGIYYLRWPLPRHLHPAKKQSTVRVSLRTRDPKAALRISRSASQMAEMVIESGSKDGMRYDDIRKLLKEHFQQMLDARKEQIAESGRLSALDRQAAANSADLPDLEIDAGVVARFVQKYALDIRPGTEQHAWLEQELRASYRSFNKAVLDHDISLEHYEFSTKESPPLTEPASSASRPHSRTSGMSIAGLAEAYEAERNRAGQWGPKTKMERADHLSLLKEILGAETDIGSLTPTDGKRVKDTLFAYPKNRTKNPATRKKSLAEVLAVEGAPTISIITMNKYLQTYADMFTWAKQNGHADDNVFAGLTVRQKRSKTADKRSPFSKAQITTIISAVTDPKGLAQKQYQKWGPLIGIYTGARLNEIAQLHVADIRQEAGIWCFDLNDDDDKQLKAAASRRLVPVHSALIGLGLLDFATEVKRNGKQRLFPDFAYCPKNGWGRNLGRWFNVQLLPKLNLKRPELVFHSLRHTVVTHLMRADVPEPIVKALVGHAQEGVTQQHYFRQGYKVEQLQAALEKLSFTEEQPSGA